MVITDGNQVIAAKRNSVLLPLSTFKSGKSDKKLKNKISVNACGECFDGWEQVLNNHKDHANNREFVYK